MFTKQVIQHAIWSRQKDHDFPIASRSVPVNFSLGPRSSLVRLSFVSRSLFVSLSKTDREPNEEQAKNERKSNECRSRCRRETIGNSTSSHRHGWLMAGKVPFSNHKLAKCLSPKSAEVKPCTSCPTLSIFSANKAISSIPTDPMVQPCRIPPRAYSTLLFPK